MKPDLSFALSAFLSAVLVGCGSNKPKNASAADDAALSPDSVEVSVDAGVTASSEAEEASEDKSVIVNGHMFVDLGLPSGLLWASFNIGAENAYEDGVRFAWGETSMTEKEDFFDIKYYEYASFDADGEYAGLTKYNKTDKKTTLEKEDDAAFVNWGEPCRMPTRAEVEELADPEYCTWTWSYNPSGYVVTSKKNGNSIFLNACGFPFDGIIDGYGLQGEFWTSTVFIDEDGDCDYAQTISFDGEDHNQNWCPVRYNGLPVRPVINQKELSQAKTLKAAPCFRIIDGHRFVDLDLPSKLLWAETNIGADSPTDAGIYFAWGETGMKQKKSYTWDSYKFGNAESGKSTKYNPMKDDIYSLDKEDDAAYVNWGHSCRMPDIDELEELGDEKNCIVNCTTITSPSGVEVQLYKVTSRRNGNFIYFPLGGFYDETGYRPDCEERNEVNVWSRTIHFYGISAFAYVFSSEQGERNVDNGRYYGFQIRPVAEL